jgi:capsular exopolysaccharide synthesis family protein
VRVLTRILKEPFTIRIKVQRSLGLSSDEFPPIPADMFPARRGEGFRRATIDRRSIMTSVGRRWKLLAAVPLLFFVGAYAVLHTMPPIYKSTVQLLLFDPGWQRQGPLRQGAALDFDAVAINTEIEIIKSLSLSRRVASELRLYEDPEFQVKGDPSARSASDGERATELLTVAAGVLREHHLRVERVPFSYVLLVSATSHNPRVAQQIATTVVDDYLTAQQEARKKALQEFASVLEQKQKSIKEYADSLAKLGDSSRDYITIQDFQRKISIENKLYDSYLSQYNELKTINSLKTESERVISSADFPTTPISPRAMLYSLAAFAFGIVVAAGLVLILEYPRLKMSNRALVEETFGHKVIGALPLLPLLQSTRGISSLRLAREILAAPPVKEAVRTIRIGLRLADAECGPKVIMVTSSLPGEGKSSIAALLATSYATAGKRTVLVDCDFQRSSLSRDFSLAQISFSDVLTKSGDLGAATIHDPVTGCYLIPAGPGTDGSDDWPVSPRTDAVFTQMRQQYDCIVLDTPPLLSTIDALALARLADTIIVAIDSTRASYGRMAEVFTLLGEEPHQVARIVFNKIDPEEVQRYGFDCYYFSESNGSSEFFAKRCRGQLARIWPGASAFRWGSCVACGLSELIRRVVTIPKHSSPELARGVMAVIVEQLKGLVSRLRSSRQVE